MYTKTAVSDTSVISVGCKSASFAFSSSVGSSTEVVSHQAKSSSYKASSQDPDLSKEVRVTLYGTRFGARETRVTPTFFFRHRIDACAVGYLLQSDSRFLSNRENVCRFGKSGFQRAAGWEASSAKT